MRGLLLTTAVATTANAALAAPAFDWRESIDSGLEAGAATAFILAVVWVFKRAVRAASKANARDDTRKALRQAERVLTPDDKIKAANDILTAQGKPPIV